MLGAFMPIAAGFFRRAAHEVDAAGDEAQGHSQGIFIDYRRRLLGRPGLRKIDPKESPQEATEEQP